MYSFFVRLFRAQILVFFIFVSCARAHAPHPLTHAHLSEERIASRERGQIRVLAFPSCVRGYHVYKDTWTSVTNEEIALDVKQVTFMIPTPSLLRKIIVYHVAVQIACVYAFQCRHTPTNQFCAYKYSFRAVRERKEDRQKNPLYTGGRTRSRAQSFAE